MRTILGFLALALALSPAGCLQPNTVSCAGGAECPADMVCTTGGCATPGNAEACTGLSEGAGCTTDRGAAGVCLGGSCQVTAWDPTVLIGANAVSAGTVGMAPFGIAIDGGGNLYIADQANARVLRLDTSGVITTIASNGTGPSNNAGLSMPTGVAVDGVGDVFIADIGSQRIQEIDPSGTITTLAGQYHAAGYSGDSGPANLARLAEPSGLAVDDLGNLFVADTGNNRVRRIDPTGIITTVAGMGAAAYSGDNGPATSAELDAPVGVAVDGAGNLLIADTGNNCVRRVDAGTGTISTIAGNGSFGSGGDGGPATLAELSLPSSVFADAAGDLVIADTESYRVRRVDGASGVITTIAGTGASGYGGDGGAAIDAMLPDPYGIAVDGAGTVYVTDPIATRIRAIDIAGQISVVAGTGDASDGDGGAAISFEVDASAIAIDASGMLYIAAAQDDRIRTVDANGILATVAGNGIIGFGGDGAAATSAELADPSSVAIDSHGNIYIADTENARIRRIDSTGTITTVAGNGDMGYSGDGGPATSAKLRGPVAVAVDAAGNLYIADSPDERVRKVDAAGTITTLAGNGQYGFGGDGSAATQAQLEAPASVAVDAAGNVYIADSQNERIRCVDTGGIISTVAGSGGVGYDGDNKPATMAGLSNPLGVAVDGHGNLYIADTGDVRIRRVDTSHIITTVVGTGFGMTPGNSGDGGPAALAQLAFPSAVAVDAQGNLYLVDDSAVRYVDGTGTITTVAGLIAPPGTGPLSQAHLDVPNALVVTSAFTLLASELSGTVERATATELDVVIGRYPQGAATGMLARYRDGGFGAVAGLAYDPNAGLIYVSESTENRIDVVMTNNSTDASTWTIAPLADSAGTSGYGDGPALTAMFRGPTGLYLDLAAQRLYVADSGNHAVRAIDLGTAMVSTVAGVGGKLGFQGDGGSAIQALLYEPRAITVCGNGDLFIADTGNNRVRRVTGGAGVISTVLGDGTAASDGEGTPSSMFLVNAPLGLACDSLGDVFVTSTTAVRLLAANADGVVDGTGGVQTIYGAQPRDTFPASVTACLSGVVVDDDATVEVTDSCSGLLVQLVRGPPS